MSFKLKNCKYSRTETLPIIVVVGLLVIFKGFPVPGTRDTELFDKYSKVDSIFDDSIDRIFGDSVHRIYSMIRYSVIRYSIDRISVRFAKIRYSVIR